MTHSLSSHCLYFCHHVNFVHHVFFWHLITSLLRNILCGFRGLYFWYVEKVTQILFVCYGCRCVSESQKKNKMQSVQKFQFLLQNFENINFALAVLVASHEVHLWTDRLGLSPACSLYPRSHPHSLALFPALSTVLSSLNKSMKKTQKISWKKNCVHNGIICIWLRPLLSNPSKRCAMYWANVANNIWTFFDLRSQ